MAEAQAMMELLRGLHWRRKLLLARSFARWLFWSLVFAFWIAPAGWVLIPRAVRRSRPIGNPDWIPDISKKSRERLQVAPRSEACERYRLIPEDQWLELPDDQILPPGLYEADIYRIYCEQGWEAASIAMLRRNVAAGWCAERGPAIVGIGGQRLQLQAAGSRPSFVDDGQGRRSYTPGRWFGMVWIDGAEVVWQFIGAFEIPRLPFAVEVNAGYVIYDLWDDTRFGGSLANAWPDGQRAKLRPGAVRLRRIR